MDSRAPNSDWFFQIHGFRDRATGAGGIHGTRCLRLLTGGGAGIRTLGGANLAGFQDQCFRPLSHPSLRSGL